MRENTAIENTFYVDTKNEIRGISTGCLFLYCEFCNGQQTWEVQEIAHYC